MKTSLLIAAALAAIMASGCAVPPRQPPPRAHTHLDPGPGVSRAPNPMTVDEYYAHLVEEERAAKSGAPSTVRTAPIAPVPSTKQLEDLRQQALAASEAAEGAQLRLDGVEPTVLDNRARIRELEARAASSSSPATPAPRAGPPDELPATADLATFKHQAALAARNHATRWRNRGRSSLATPKFKAYAERMASAYDARARRIAAATNMAAARYAATH